MPLTYGAGASVATAHMHILYPGNSVGLRSERYSFIVGRLVLWSAESIIKITCTIPRLYLSTMCAIRVLFGLFTLNTLFLQ